MKRVDMRIVWSLAFDMNLCRSQGVSFAECLRLARIEFNKEVRTQADATPLPGSKHPA